MSERKLREYQGQGWWGMLWGGEGHQYLIESMVTQADVVTNQPILTGDRSRVTQLGLRIFFATRSDAADSMLLRTVSVRTLRVRSCILIVMHVLVVLHVSIRAKDKRQHISVPLPHDARARLRGWCGSSSRL